MSFLDKAQINLYQFYKMGMICFGVVAVASSYSLYSNWLFLNIGARISSMGSITFNICLILFFNWLYNQLPTKEQASNMPDEKELNNFMEKLE